MTALAAAPVEVRPEEVRLEPWEIVAGALVGVRRHCLGLAAGLPDRGGSVRDPWGADVNGSLAELAVAKLLGWYWDAYVGRRGRGHGDVSDLEVRWTGTGLLRVDPRDPDDAVFVLVTGEAPSYLVWGWMTGAEAKRVGRLESLAAGRAPQHWVAPALLHPMSELAR